MPYNTRQNKIYVFSGYILDVIFAEEAFVKLQERNYINVPSTNLLFIKTK